VKKVMAVLALCGMLTVTGCTDPNECKPGDIDRDNDGLCNER
jgi:hypothetical protein